MTIEGLQRLEKNGVRFVQMPETSFQELLAHLEDAQDIAAVRHAKEMLAAGEETFPGELVLALAKTKKTGKKIAIWREYRQMTKTELGASAGVTGQHIGMIEAGKRKGDITLLKKITKALDIQIGDIV